MEVFVVMDVEKLFKMTHLETLAPVNSVAFTLPPKLKAALGA